MEQKEGQQVESSAKKEEKVQVESKSTGSKKLLIIGCVIALIVGILAICGSVAAYLILKEGGKEDDGGTSDTTTTTTTEDISDEDEEEEEDEEEDDDEDDEEEVGDSLVPLDSGWSLYTNYDLGFSMEIPNDFYYQNGGCKWSTEDGDHSYRPDPAYVPTAIFYDSDNQVVYISAEYYYELSGETTEGGITYYANCNQVLNSLAKLQDEYSDYWHGWKLVVETINNDTELASFIEERYGEGCEIGDRTPTGQEGVYDVALGGEFGFEESPDKCNVNYSTVMKYYPAGNKLVAWDTGQASMFYDHEYNSYDLEMIESFRFE